MTEVHDGSPASRSGLRIHDKILQVSIYENNDYRLTRCDKIFINIVLFFSVMDMILLWSPIKKLWIILRSIKYLIY